MVYGVIGGQWNGVVDCDVYGEEKEEKQMKGGEEKSVFFPRYLYLHTCPLLST